jgi:membrane associated rhomboid family serine protease
MERLLARLERRLGAYAIPHLTVVIVAGMAVAFVLCRARPASLATFALDLDAVGRGEVWRLITYLFLPRTLDPMWIVFSLMFFWFILSSLESHWGSFRFNLFYLLGCAGTTLAAWLTGQAETNWWINCSLILAFGTVFPDTTVYIIILPIRAKWYAIFTAAYMGYSLIEGANPTRAAIVASLAGYAVLCGPAVLALLRQRNLIARQTARRVELGPTPVGVQRGRTCAMCGASEEDGADIRVCTCQKCGKPTCLCLNHARNH